MNQFRTNEVNQWIKDLNASINEAIHLDRIQNDFERTLEGRKKIAERKEAENEKVRQFAEKVYNHYLPQGETIANERKAIYLSRNLN